MAFSEEYLKDYENKIRKLPVEELYEILDMIRDHPFKADDSPERIRIIEKRIIELTGDKDCILPREEYNKKIEQEYLEKTNPLVVGLEVLGALLILIAEASSNPLSLLLCALGFLIIGLCVLFDGKLKIYLVGWASICTKKEHPKIFWSLAGFFCLLGISLLVYSIPYL